MTLDEFERERNARPCKACGATGLATRRNPNNNGLQVFCPHCQTGCPWGSLLYLKQTERRSARPPLLAGETLDSIWERFGNRCVICSAPKTALASFGIGRQVHHVLPYAQYRHQGPLIPICTHCHPVVTDRQRIYWFLQRVVMKSLQESGPGDSDGTRPESPDRREQNVQPAENAGHGGAVGRHVSPPLAVRAQTVKKALVRAPDTGHRRTSR